MKQDEAIAFARAAVGQAKPPPPRRELPDVQPLPSDVIVRDPEEWARREKWITKNGGQPLPAEDGDA